MEKSLNVGSITHGFFKMDIALTKYFGKYMYIVYALFTGILF